MMSSANISMGGSQWPNSRTEHPAGDWCLLDQLLDQMPDDLRCLINFFSSFACFSLWFLILVYKASALRGRAAFHPAAARLRLRMHHLRWILALLLCLTHWADVVDIAVVHRQPVSSAFLVLFNSAVVLFSCFYYDRIEVHSIR